MKNTQHMKTSKTKHTQTTADMKKKTKTRYNMKKKMKKNKTMNNKKTTAVVINKTHKPDIVTIEKTKKDGNGDDG